MTYLKGNVKVALCFFKLSTTPWRRIGGMDA